MTLVPRFVHQISDHENTSTERTSGALQDFRTHAAWILLGEPGAGKSEALRMEADAAGGKYLSIAEFTALDIEPDWQGKTLFLDGLDEVRASGEGGNILLAIRNKLNKLGKPPFRLACRAADWLGSTDKAAIQAASPDGRIMVLQLKPLTAEDILCILRDNHHITDPQSFVEEAGKRGVAALLDNPQTLGLLASAVRQNGTWPASRQETYALACEEMAKEANKTHRDKRRGQSLAIGNLLDAAGQLCAVLLLSDKSGVALDMDSANLRFPSLNDFSPPDMPVAEAVVRRKLFRPDGENRVVPSHRSVAEYLAARWLAQQIDQESLPLGRVLNLLLGRDGGVVAGLRGLFAWLALHCLSARTRLIDADPFTVIAYGDVKNFHSDDKRRLLANLGRDAESGHSFQWDLNTDAAFGALADPGLHNDFLAILQSQDCGDISLVPVEFVFDILLHGDALQDLAPAVLDIIRDDSECSEIRVNALNVWLKLIDDPKEKVSLLDQVTAGQIPDSNDGLAGTLLYHLYPAHFLPEALFKYLRPGKKDLYGGIWVDELPRVVPDAHLPALLDELAGRPELVSDDVMYRDFHRMVDLLLVRGITAFGDNIAPERLFAWLGIGQSEYGSIRREENQRKEIAAWLTTHPDCYKALLALCIDLCGSDEMRAIYKLEKRLHGAMPPSDLGLWHVKQASATSNDFLINTHLARAVNTLIYQASNAGLSLEQIEQWRDTHPEKTDLINSLLCWEIEDWRVEDARSQLEFQRRNEQLRRKQTLNIAPHLSDVRAGTANPGVMQWMAEIWGRPDVEITGDSTDKRFNDHFENGGEVLAAAESGFRLCLDRSDLPTVEDIIQTRIREKIFHLCWPCLIGMQLRWQDNPAEIDLMGDETLRRMVAFYLTSSPHKTAKWYLHFVRSRADLVVEVFVAYASAMLKSKQDYVNSLHLLETVDEYRAVAIIAAPRILEAFPVRARVGQLGHLRHLLRAALRYAQETLPAIVAKKLARKGMDATQKVLWLATALLLNPQDHEEALWRHVGKNEMFADHLTAFLLDDFRQTGLGFELSVATMGKLVELLGPHAEMERMGGTGRSPARHRGEHIRTLINNLALIATREAAQELDRLLGLSSMQKIRHLLESARHQQTLRRREAEFRFPSPKEVAQVLTNQAPTRVADLAALALDILDEIAKAIRCDNDDGFRAFWNVETVGQEKKQKIGRREENLCRDALLTRFFLHMKPHGVTCLPEVDHANDKRADLCLIHGNQLELPIEIKRDDNRQMWTGLRDQLIGQYAISPLAKGYGIYLVLWFGEGKLPGAKDGGKTPQTPQELKARLEAQLQPDEQQRIFVRVLDVSWPK